jgi:WD repeat-containing protein 19
VLSSHDSINLPPGSRYTQDKLRAAAVQLLALGRMREAWELCINIRTKDLYQQVARRALELLDIDFAVRAYRELGDVATELMLQPLVESDDRSLVAGYVCVLNGYRVVDVFLPEHVF